METRRQSRLSRTKMHHTKYNLNKLNKFFSRNQIWLRNHGLDNPAILFSIKCRHFRRNNFSVNFGCGFESHRGQNLFFTYYSIRVESEELICKTNKDPAILYLSYFSCMQFWLLLLEQPEQCRSQHGARGGNCPPKIWFCPPNRVCHHAIITLVAFIWFGYDHGHGQLPFKITNRHL